MEAAQTTRVAGRVRRRMLAGAVVLRAGRGLVAGSAVGLALVLATRTGWLVSASAAPEATGTVPWWGLLAASVGGGLVIGGGLGLLHRRTLLEAAQTADAVSGLRDRLSNALSFSRGPSASASEQLAITDGERSSERVDVRTVAPVRFGAAWVVWPLVVALAVASGLWVPVRQRQAVTPVAQREATDAERAAAAEAIAAAVSGAREMTPGPVGARATAEELDRMEQIERELLDGDRSPADALAEGAQQLESIADRVEREAAAEALADQATREAIADSIDAGEDDSALARALADGDLEAARDAAAELFDRIDQLSPEERQRLADELDRLAEQSARAPAQGPETDPSGADPESSGPEPRLDELLREQGLEDLADIARSQDSNTIRERLEQEGLEPEVARRLAEEIARENRQRAAEESANDARDELANAAREAAEELREPPAPRPDGVTPQDANPPNTDPERPTPPEGREQDRQNDTPRDGTDRPSEQGQNEQSGTETADQQPGQDQSRQDGQTQRGDEGQPQDGQQGEQSQSGSEGQSQQRRQGGQEQDGAQTQGDQQEQGGQQESGEQTGQQSEGAESDAAGREEGVADRPGGERDATTPRSGDPQSGNSQPGESDSGTPETGAGESGRQGPERMTDGQGEAPDPRGVERLREQLDRMAERSESAQEKRRSAEKLREQAERMLDGASPEEREQLEELAREMARDGGGEPGGGAGTGPKRAEGARPTPDRAWDTEDVDARGELSGEPEDDGRVIAEWFGKDSEQPARAASSGQGTGAGSVVDEAARGAERAVERRAVPRERRELIRRVFERYRQRAAERESSERSDESGGGS